MSTSPLEFGKISNIGQLTSRQLDSDNPVQILLRQLISHCPPPPTINIGQTIQRYIVRSKFFFNIKYGGGGEAGFLVLKEGYFGTTIHLQ